jgi:hypothetical protein
VPEYDDAQVGKVLTRREVLRHRNDKDGIYRSGGGQLLLRPSQTSEGMSATFDIGLQVD